MIITIISSCSSSSSGCSIISSKNKYRQSLNRNVKIWHNQKIKDEIIIIIKLLGYKIKQIINFCHLWLLLSENRCMATWFGAHYKQEAGARFQLMLVACRHLQHPVWLFFYELYQNRGMAKWFGAHYNQDPDTRF